MTTLSKPRAVLLTAALPGLLTVLGGCAALAGDDAPWLDARFGDAVRLASTSQTANPGAGRAPTRAAGFDAQSAVSAITKHRDSFKSPPPSFAIIGIGGASSGGQ